MSDPKRRFFSGDSLQQALVQAANYHHLQPEEIAYRSLEKRHGFIKVRRKVVIEVDPSSPRREASAKSVVADGSPAKGGPSAANAGAADNMPAYSRSAPVGAPADPGAHQRTAEQVGMPERVAAHRGGVDAGAPEAGVARPPLRHGGQARSHSPRQAGGAGLREERGQYASGGGRGPLDDQGGRRGQMAQLGREGQPGRNGQLVSGSPDHRDRGGRQPRRPSGAYPPARGGRPGDVGLGTGESLVELPERPRSTGERYPEATGPQAEGAATGIELLLRVAGLNLKARIYQGEERLEIDLVGGDTDWCFADDGELLMSIEHLLPRIIRSLSGEAALCRVDCDNFHEIREERLRSLAQRVADEVRQRGRARTLVPMNPADRRIVHVTLADDPGVVTESEGEGYFKRITVRPA